MQSQADLICGKVRSCGISDCRNEIRRGRRTDFCDDAGHVEALGVADAAAVLSVETWADAIETVSGDEIVDGLARALAAKDRPSKAVEYCMLMMLMLMLLICNDRWR
jgi:hypothetical protein